MTSPSGTIDVYDVPKRHDRRVASVGGKNCARRELSCGGARLCVNPILPAVSTLPDGHRQVDPAAAARCSSSGRAVRRGRGSGLVQCGGSWPRTLRCWTTTTTRQAASSGARGGCLRALMRGMRTCSRDARSAVSASSSATPWCRRYSPPGGSAYLHAAQSLRARLLYSRCTSTCTTGGTSSSLKSTMAQMRTTTAA